MIQKTKSSCIGKIAHKKGVEKIQEEHQQAIIEIQGTHQQVIEAIKFDNIGLQEEIQARDQQISRSKKTITHLREFYEDHTKDHTKSNIIVV